MTQKTFSAILLERDIDRLDVSTQAQRALIEEREANIKAAEHTIETYEHLRAQHVAALERLNAVDIAAPFFNNGIMSTGPNTRSQATEDRED